MSEVLQRIFDNLSPELLEAERKRVKEEIVELTEREQMIGSAVAKQVFEDG